MKINYFLNENPLSTSEENRFTARVKTRGTQSKEDLIDAMLSRNTTVTRQDIIVVLDLLKETVKAQVLSGFNLVTDLFKVNLSIRGGFAAEDEQFDSRKHRVCVNLNASSEFRKEMIKDAEVELVQSGRIEPKVTKVWDYTGKTFTAQLPAGGLIRIKGAFMAEENRETRVFLEPEGTDEKIFVESLHSVTDLIILCNLPADLNAGRYTLYVERAGEGNNMSRGSLKEFVTIT